MNKTAGVGFKKKGSHTKLLFKCTSLSPSVTMKLDSSFKVNVKSNMKKKLYFCMAEPESKKMMKFKQIAKDYGDKDIYNVVKNK